MNKYFFLFALCISATILLSTSGCGGDAKLSGVYPASGTITLNGTPLPGATITLIPETSGPESRGASALSDESGKFTLSTLKADDGAFPGTYKVTVTKKEVQDPLTPEEEAAGAGGAKTRDVVAVNTLPEKYSRAATTDLTLKIEASKNKDLKIELTDN